MLGEDIREDRNMKIQMYNMGLGECFLLEEGEERIAVNCGSRNKKINRTECGVLYREIKDRTKNEGYDFLLTQFDPEHISGFLQFEEGHMDSRGRSLYLPDLFSERWMSELLALLLLQDLSIGGFLPGKAVTLAGLMETLLHSSYTLHFLKRGDCIGKVFQVLWPQKDMLKKDMEKALSMAGISNAFYEQDRWMWRELVRVSSGMRGIFMRLHSISGDPHIPRNDEGIPVELEEEVHWFRTEFRKLRRNQQFLGMAGRCQQKLEVLRKFHDQTGLLFHTSEDDGRCNFLYTGSAWKEKVKWLESNEDGVAGIHTKYWCIALPGHGTDECYWDFSGYSPVHFLISNGYVAGQDNGKVSGRYSGMFAVPGVTMHCTNTDWCEGQINGICGCWDSQITAPKQYSIISSGEE